MPKVILNFKRDYATVHHHPWIFSGAIKEVEGNPRMGETVEVVNARGDFLGYGSYSPFSQIRVRMLSFAKGEVPSAELIAKRVADAVARRASFWTNGLTNGVRIVNAESDGLPGVIADFYDGFVVVQLATAGAEFWKGALVDAFMKHVPGCRGVYNRSDVDARTREGLREKDADGHVVEDPSEKGCLAGAEPPELIEIKEGAIRYLVDVRKGHKTGFYLDQRDARAAVGALAKDADVLNCFSYTGGFGLAACAAGAKSVTHLDVSADALALAKRNTELNPSATVSDFVEADVFKQLDDPSRLKIFWLLCHDEECVINLSSLMDMSSPAVSHHLNKLRSSGLIVSRREGKEVYYRAADTVQARALHETIEHIMEITCPK